MFKTDWTIKSECPNIKTYKNEKLQTICLDEHAALHSIFVTEGSNPDEYYNVHNGVVTMTKRSLLKVERGA